MRSGTAGKIYHNGVEVSYATTTALVSDPVTSPYGFSIGNRNDEHVLDDGIYFNGKIDDVRIHKGTVLTASQIQAIYANGRGTEDTSEGYDVSEDVVLHLDMNDNAASTTVTDSGSYGYDGTLAGGDNTEDLSVAGKVDGALDLDGSADYVSLDAYTADFLTATEGTVALWCYASADDDGTEYMFDIGSSASWSELRLRLDWANDRVSAAILPDNTTQWSMYTDTDSLDGLVGSWIHVALVQDGVAPVLYLNGVAYDNFGTTTDTTQWLDDLGSASAVPTLTSIGVRRGPAYTGNHYDGGIDEVLVLKRAMTPDEILAIYNEGNGTEEESAWPLGADGNGWMSLTGVAQTWDDALTEITAYTLTATNTATSNYTVSVSLDAGTNWTDVVLAADGFQVAGLDRYSGTTNGLTASGNEILWRINTTNNADTAIHALGISGDVE